jgi:hypothetical protein
VTQPHDDAVDPSPASGTAVSRPPARSAAGIYGTIVTASVLATAGGSLPTLALTIAVFVTLVVYWVAEEYAEIGEHVSAGRLPGWPDIRAAMAAKWPMVSASYLPLVTLIGADVLGTTPSTAAYVALVVTVLLLVLFGWTAARAAGLSTVGQLGMTLVAGVLGLLMIALKSGLSHLH